LNSLCLLHAVKLVWTKPLLPIVQIWWIIGAMSLSSFIREFPTRDQKHLRWEPMFMSGASTHSTWQRTPIKWFLECIKRLFHTTSTQKSGPLRVCYWESFSHLYSKSIFYKVGTKVWDLTGNLLINSRTWALRNVSFQKCRYESYRDSYRTWSAQAFSSHPATWASLVS
jgi:hypothetical protein